MFSKLPKSPKLHKLTTPPYPPLQEKLFGLSIFLFSQRLCPAEMKNGNWDRSINMTKTIEDGQTEGLPQAALIKGRFGGIVSITGNSRLFKTTMRLGLIK